MQDGELSSNSRVILGTIVIVAWLGVMMLVPLLFVLVPVVLIIGLIGLGMNKINDTMKDPHKKP